MSLAPEYRFDWHADKARTNLQKHKISFPTASTVFRDALAITVYDDEHSDDGDQRWATIGQASNGQTLVVVHTFKALVAVAHRAAFDLGAKGRSPGTARLRAGAALGLHGQ